MTLRSDSARVVLALVVAVTPLSCGGDEFDEGDGTLGSSPDGSAGSGGQGAEASGGSSGAGGRGGGAGGTGGSSGNTGGAGGSAGGVSDASAGTGDAGGTGGSTGEGAVEIQQIQDGTVGLGAEVRVEKVFITATRQQTSSGLNFALQEPLGQTTSIHPYPEYAAITAFAPPAIAAGIDNRSIGDCVNVMGTVDEFQAATQITVSTLELAADCGTVPTPFNIPAQFVTFADVATDVDVNAPGEQPGARAEAFEGVLVEVQAIEAATAPDSAGLFRAVEQSNVTGPNLVIGDFYYAIAATPGQQFVSLTGIFTQFGSYHLNPRSIGDVIQ